MQPLKFILFSTTSVVKSFNIDDAITIKTITGIVNNLATTIKHCNVKDPQLIIKYNEDKLIVPIHNNFFRLNFEIIFAIEKIIWLNSEISEFNQNEHILSIAKTFGWNANTIRRAQFHSAVMNIRKLLEKKYSREIPKSNSQRTRKIKDSSDRRDVINTNSYAEKTYMDYLSQQPFKQKNYTNVAIIN